MSLGHWIASLQNGDRPGAVLVISGPQGSGKSLLTNTLLEGIDMHPFEIQSKRDLIRLRWDDSTAIVFREDTDAALAKELVCGCEQVITDGGVNLTAPTPRAVIVETLRPEVYQGRRFIHVQLGGSYEQAQ